MDGLNRKSTLSSGTAYRFGLFSLDVSAGSLTRNGILIKLQDQPFQLLALLLEKRGEVVTREEIRQRLWKSNTFVDFDKSLGVAVVKVREALTDSAGNPRFLETVPRRGYRFIAPVSVEVLAGSSPVAVSNGQADATVALVPTDLGLLVGCCAAKDRRQIAAHAGRHGQAVARRLGRQDPPRQLRVGHACRSSRGSRGWAVRWQASARSSASG